MKAIALGKQDYNFISDKGETIKGSTLHFAVEMASEVGTGYKPDKVGLRGVVLPPLTFPVKVEMEVYGGRLIRIERIEAVK